MTDICARVRKPFDREDWKAIAPTEPYYVCSDDGSIGNYDWGNHGLRVQTRFDASGETTATIALSLTDLAGDVPWPYPLPYGLKPSMDGAQAQELLGPPARTFENPHEERSAYPYPYLSWDTPDGVRLTVFFRRGQMFGVSLQ